MNKHNFITVFLLLVCFGLKAQTILTEPINNNAENIKIDSSYKFGGGISIGKFTSIKTLKNLFLLQNKILGFDVESFTFFYQPKEETPSTCSNAGNDFSFNVLKLMAIAKPDDTYYFEDIIVKNKNNQKVRLLGAAYKIK